MTVALCAQKALISCILTRSGRWLFSTEVQHGFGPWLNPRSSGGQGVDDYVGGDPHCWRIDSLCVCTHLKPSTLTSSLVRVNRTVPLGIVILGRDVLLSLSAFWIRWKTLPPPVSCVSNTSHGYFVAEQSFEEKLPTLLGFFAPFRRSSTDTHIQGVGARGRLLKSSDDSLPRLIPLCNCC